MVTGAEPTPERSKRLYQRTLFDGVAQLYDASRPSYPREIVDFVLSKAALSVGQAVLEVGCGTGQLTERLVPCEFNLTAIDIGPQMIAAARSRLDGSAVSFQVTSFEDFAASEASFDLVISGTAFHWIDPEIKFHKSARLLRPGGWLALLATGERYDDPFGATLRGMWDARSDDGGAWRAHAPVTDHERIAATGLFDTPIRRTDARRTVLPVDAVIGLENTRATSLSWPEDIRRTFSDELRHHLRSQTEVPLTRQTSLTMARVLERNPVRRQRRLPALFHVAPTRGDPLSGRPRPTRPANLPLVAERIDDPAHSPAVLVRYVRRGGGTGADRALEYCIGVIDDQ